MLLATHVEDVLELGGLGDLVDANLRVPERLKAGADLVDLVVGEALALEQRLDE